MFVLWFLRVSLIKLPSLVLNFYVAQAGLDLMILSCLNLQKAGIPGLYHPWIYEETHGSQFLEKLSLETQWSPGVHGQ